MKKGGYITGYAMKTVAGTESSFSINVKHGKTDSKFSDWNHSFYIEDLQSFCNLLKETIDRALQMAKIVTPTTSVISLVIASNFFENKFWEQDDQYTIKYENFIQDYLTNIYCVNGFALSNSTACSSGGSAIVTACQLIEDGIAETVIVVGYDTESEIPKNGMRRIGALAKEQISPFSLGRTGTDLADGIGVMIIDEAEAAQKRAAVPIAKVIGYGVYSDSFNVTSPEPSGRALFNAMQRAIEMAGLTNHDVNYINAHGSGTVLNDELETKVIREVFGEHADHLFVNSSKSLIGHTLGAAGVIEAIITVIQMKSNLLHPTANFLKEDPACDLNYCFEHEITCDIDYAISNSIGFGGTNVCLLLERS